MGMLDAQLIIKNFLLLNALLFKKRSVLCLHTDSFDNTIIVENYPQYEQSKRYQEKKLFRFRPNILPDSIDNFFHAS